MYYANKICSIIMDKTRNLNEIYTLLRYLLLYAQNIIATAGTVAINQEEIPSIRFYYN